MTPDEMKEAGQRWTAIQHLRKEAVALSTTLAQMRVSMRGRDAFKVVFDPRGDGDIQQSRMESYQYWTGLITCEVPSAILFQRQIELLVAVERELIQRGDHEWVWARQRARDDADKHRSKP